VVLTGCTTGNRLSIPENYRLVETHKMKVYADTDWQKSDYEIQKGDFLRITALGKWNFGLGSCGAKGQPTLNVILWLVPPCQVLPLFFSIKMFHPNDCLIGELGDGRLIAVGREYSLNNIDGDYSGQFFLGPNDRGTFNNDGHMDVTMEVYRKGFSQKPIEETPKPTITHTPTVPIQSRWAIIVGLSSYENAGKNGLTNLVFADDDAKQFYQALLKQGWDKDHIKLLTNKQATEKNIKIALESWLTKAGKDDLIVLFWSGHGYPDPENPEKVYFACYDTDINIPATGYRMDRVRDVLEERNARNVIMFADTCHAGKLITRGEKGLSVRPYVEKLKKEQKSIPKGWIFMVSAEADRKAIEHSSWKNGAFTHCLLKAMEGKADGYDSVDKKDGIVTMREIKEYMRSEMPDQTQKVLGVAKRPTITTSSGDPGIWSLSLESKK